MIRILQLCHKPPVPPVDGGCIAMFRITQGLLDKGYHVHILSMETFKHRVLNDRIDQSFVSKTGMETIFVDIRVKWYEALANLLTSHSYNITRFYDKTYANRLAEILEKNDYDIVLFESLFTSMYLDVVRKHSKAKTIYRAHNIEQQIWEHHYRNQRNPLKKWYLKLLYGRLKKYEDDIAVRFDGIAAINNSEKAYFDKIAPQQKSIVIPVAIPIPPASPVKSDPLTFFHIGSMDWTPNQEGIKWLLDKIWSDITPGHPGLTLHLAGRKMPEWLLHHKQKNVVIHGEVKDAVAFIAKHEVMIVPLFSASGVRIKILEAMAMGKAVLCTEVAAAGIPYTRDKNILIADTAAEFREKIEQLTENKINAGEIGRAAKQMIEENYNNAEVTEQLSTFFNQVLNH